MYIIIKFKRRRRELQVRGLKISKMRFVGYRRKFVYGGRSIIESGMRELEPGTRVLSKLEVY